MSSNMTLAECIEFLEGDGTGMELPFWRLAKLGECAHHLRREYARAERYREALRSIANNTCCEPCREAALVARAALGEGE